MLCDIFLQVGLQIIEIMKSATVLVYVCTAYCYRCSDVCLSVCWSREPSEFAKKRINRSRCHSDSLWPNEHVVDGDLDSPRKGALVGIYCTGHIGHVRGL